MKSLLALGIVSLLTTGAHAGQSPNCAQLDRDLVYCPQPQTPRITELGEGNVVVEFSVNPDGSVSNAHVITSDSQTHWNSAAVQAVSQWRYKPSGHSVHKSQHFKFNFQP
jgi:protein TonB